MISTGNISIIELLTRATGTPFSLIEMAVENQISLDFILNPGQVLKEASFQEIEPDNFNDIIVNYIKKENTKTAILSQSIFDISVQETGNIFFAFDVALENKFSLNQSLTPGQKIIIPNVEKENDVVQHFKGLGISIATFQNEVPNYTYEIPGEFPYSF